MTQLPVTYVECVGGPRDGTKIPLVGSKVPMAGDLILVRITRAEQAHVEESGIVVIDSMSRDDKHEYRIDIDVTPEGPRMLAYHVRHLPQ